MKVELSEDEISLTIRSLRFKLEMQQTIMPFSYSAVNETILLQKLKDITSALQEITK